MDNEQITSNKPLTIVEASVYLSLSVSYIYRLVHEKRITYFKPSGSLRSGRVYFRKEDLDSFVFRGRSSADFELAEQAERILNESERRKR